jgi:iron(III) transport system ATP-binding protein
MQIRFDGITQRYDAPLFEGLNLEIPSGLFFTLLGPSGCGKTTLLRMLAGFVTPQAGRVWFGDRDVTHLSAHKRGVGMVFQDYALFPDRSVTANVMYGLDARGVARREARERALRILQRVGVADFAERSPASLSGGQRQRVAMARALVIQPQVLLLDEPLSALDVKLRVELRAMVRELQLESGITTVFVTHDQEEALAMSDAIAVMDRGRIVQVGAPAEIYARPRTAFAADFLGGANLIQVQEELVPTEASKRRFKVPGGIVSVTAEPGGPDAFRRPVLALRREEFELGVTGSNADNELVGRVEAVEFRGSITGYRIRAEAGVLHVDVWSAQPTVAYKRGDSVVLRIPPSARVVEGEA